MDVKIKYWTSVIKNFLIFLLTLFFIFIIFKLAIFYIPFLIGFIISLIIEPLIKKFANKTGFTRKTSATIILIIIFTLLIGIICFGIITLITESSNFLESINLYIEKILNLFQKYIVNFNIKEINLPTKLVEFLQNSVAQLIDIVTSFTSKVLTKFLETVTSIPIAFIYIVITIISTYFICTDKFYILDQLEHHVPRLWVKRFGKHVKEISTILGNYLKAELVLVIISFFIVLAGLIIGKLVGLNIEYPLLSALGIGFVDALPILRFWYCNYPLGNNFFFRWKFIISICFNRFICNNNSCKTNIRTKTCK